MTIAQEDEIMRLERVRVDLLRMIEEQTEEIARLRALIVELIGAPQDLDPRLRYVEAQIDRATWEQAQKEARRP